MTDKPAESNGDGRVQASASPEGVDSDRIKSQTIKDNPNHWTHVSTQSGQNNVQTEELSMWERSEGELTRDTAAASGMDPTVNPSPASRPSRPPSLSAPGTVEHVDLNWGNLFWSSSNLPGLQPMPLTYSGSTWPTTDDTALFTDSGALIVKDTGCPNVRPTSGNTHGSRPATTAFDAGWTDLSPLDPDMTGHFLDIFGNASALLSPRDVDWDKILASGNVSPRHQVHEVMLTDHEVPFHSTLADERTGTFRSGENIARLGDQSEESAPWSQTPDAWRDQHFSASENFANILFNETTRERMLGIAQSFFAMALNTLSLSSNSTSGLFLSFKNYSSARILLLPPSSIIQKYFENYLTSFEPFYPLIPERKLDPNKIINDRQGEVAVILLLLLIAYGSMRDSAAKARRLSIGLLEVCSLALVKLMDKDPATPRSALALHCGIQCVYQTAFSGDKWLMGTVGQMCQYVSLARNMCLLGRSKYHECDSHSEEGTNVEHAWKSWKDYEYNSRLAYSCIMIDQEVNLFYDGNLSVAIYELERPIPEADDLWLANDPIEWWKLRQGQETSEFGEPQRASPRQQSLRELFRSLLEDRTVHWQGTVGVLHMRLLLYPIHILICHLCETFLCEPNRVLTRSSSHNFRTSSILRLEEIRSLLRTWNDFMRTLVPTGTRGQALKNLTMIIYHLLNLNMVVSFVQVERYAQVRDGHGFHETSGNIQSWIRSPQEAMFHCGQTLRIIRETASELRPLWWPAAVYRVAIILWAVSTTSTTRETRSDKDFYPPSDIIIDITPPEDEAWQFFLKYDRGKPQLSGGNGKRVSMDDPQQVLQVCVELLKTDSSVTPYGMTMARKLENVLKQCAERGA
ncbi:hypothetical protein LTR10_023372 [Elasticomyces elasticus]|uniref:Transcription factor domain-containing protein n=1 Tax=Exophiala sideris TaxID=1016849 RepID=A0ABR0IUI8_9EURO|nr:hypothetical protein LTR10_023372 [Elasticomyces elasticus]KAK5023145.1 hypothetical protein LTR13_011289 [Exophiala sideris]KAK5023367.1 hypothetical protein LTS07_009242 [Exophiala sideris]KAK5048729.1 hypothetical protein LTR69_011320 [Exophiala sideris]KAK5176131.1 hypothetical protein LTR44_011310 [Eurotiomycetes sp. CCFEE 6388]